MAEGYKHRKHVGAVSMLWFSSPIGNPPPHDICTYVFEVPEGHKLDDVSKDRLALGRPQNPIVTIQHLHVTEVSVPHAHNDDGHGEVGGMDDGLPSVCHVRDDTVSQDQQDEVLLLSDARDRGGRRAGETRRIQQH